MPNYRLYLAVIALSALAQGTALASTPDSLSAPTADSNMLAQASAPAKTDASSVLSTTKKAPESTGTTPQSTNSEPQATAASERVPMTTREQALEKAKLGAGRDNPFSAINASEDFAFIPDAKPKPDKHSPSESPSKKSALVPPPPPTMGIAPAPAPPPPGDYKASFQLPEPPARPKLADHLKLVGILGQQALFVFTDGQLRRMNHWPHNLALSAGEQFESVNLISVDDHLVTLEEDGVRTVRELKQIR